MPEVTGLEMIEQIKKNHDPPDLRMIILSTEAKDKNLDKCKELGINGWMLKPVDNVGLKMAIKKMTN